MTSKAELYTMQGHCCITLSNGYRLSMTNYGGAHCHNAREDTYTSRSIDCEVMIFDCDNNDITKVFFKDASPDASNVSMDAIGKILVELGMNGGPYKRKDLE